MKILLVLIGVGICCLWTVTLFAAFSAGVRAAAKQKMREYGIHSGMLPLYRRAVKLLNRLAAITDLEGAMAGDVLSSETQHLVKTWVKDYKEEINKT